MAELRYWIWLSSMDRVRPRAKALLLRRCGGAREAYFMRREEYAALDFLNDEERDALSDKRIDSAKRIISECSENDIGILTLQDAMYPRRLAEIYDPPLVLYVRGKLPPVDDMCAVAVVGTRNATPYGIKMAQRMGYGICEGGGMVVSGLTRGVDAAAAHGAVMAGGKCVGVLGTAIDDRQANNELAYDVMATGAVISEYPPGTRGKAAFFRARNRVTSGLSVATLVVEAPERSGALLFADEALNQGREVFAVPANADAENAAGSNRLIMEGASPVLRAWDVLSQFTGIFPSLNAQGSGRPMPQDQAEDYAAQAETAADGAKPGKDAGAEKKKPRVKKLRTKKDIDKPVDEEYIDLQKQLSELSETQLAIIAAIACPHTHVDDVIERTGIPAAEVLGELTMLQIKGYVSQEPGKRFSLNITSQK